MSSPMLASDLANPDFAGAHNPDSHLAVIFYAKPVQHEFESQQKGRPIFYDCDFVKIFVPGDATSIIDRPVREDDKARFPMHWAHYQNKRGGDQREIGTPLSQWPRLTPSQVEELRALKFFTVENVANASDANLQRIGMVAGMDPYKFRDAAMHFLRVANEESTATESEARAKAAEEKAAALEAEMAALKEQVAALAMKKKPGRKPKEAVE